MRSEIAIASTTVFEFSTLPPYIQKEVMAHMEWVRDSYANEQCRHFASHGFASAPEYREHLLREFKHEDGAVKAAIQATLLERYQRCGQTEQWMKPIINEYPQLLASSLKL